MWPNTNSRAASVHRWQARFPAWRSARLCVPSGSLRLARCLRLRAPNYLREDIMLWLLDRGSGGVTLGYRGVPFLPPLEKGAKQRSCEALPRAPMSA